MRIHILLLILFFTSINFQLFAQGVMEISRIDSEIIIDGIPDESAWQKLEPLSMISYFPEAGKPPTEQSDIRIGHDGNFIYVAARLYYSDPKVLKATTYKRDYSGSDSDFFGILLDTHNNNETSLAFWVTPTGSRTDAVITGDAEGVFNFDWNEFWDSQIKLTENEWTVEMRIPFSSLRYQLRDGKVVMGLIVQRWIARKNEASIFPMIPNDFGFTGMFKPSQSRKIELSGLENQTPFRVAPYLLGGFGQEQSLNPSETGYKRVDQFTYDAGLDIKYGISSNLALDLTLNTDFAQVEADNQQVNLTRFSLFFPEKRQFFQERSSLFNFSFGGNDRLFYSRKIGIYEGEEVRILGGARLTGSVGDWDLGFLNMQTAREESIAPENFGVLRVRRKMFNNYSWGGGMITSRINPDGTSNYALGLDGVFRLFGDTYLVANIAQTMDEGASVTFADPEASRVRLQLERRNIRGFGYDLEYSRSGSEYNPGIGFELREDFTKWGNQLFYGWFPGENSKVMNYTVSLSAETYQRNLDGSAETVSVSPQLSVNMKSGSSFGIGTAIIYEDIRQEFELPGSITIDPDSYTYYPAVDIFYSTSTSRQIEFNSSVSAGEFYDGFIWSASFSPSWSVNPNLKFGGYYEINRLDFSNRNQLFTAHLSRLRAEYYFNAFLSLSSFVQYSNTTEQITSNFRLRYNPREGNDLYIVYNDALNNDRYRVDPALPVSNYRTIMLKYTYTFNF